MKLPSYKVMVVLTAFTAVVAVGSVVEAQTMSVSRCLAAKLRCVEGYTHICGVQGVLGLLKCHQFATIRGRFVDQVCANRTTDEITECFQAAERLGDCATTGDVLDIQAKIEAFVTDAVRDVTPGFPFPISNKCAAGKQKSIADATAAKLSCFATGSRRGAGSVEPSCFDTPEAKFANAWAKLESKGECLTEGDAGAIEAKLNAFVADIIVALDP